MGLHIDCMDLIILKMEELNMTQIELGRRMGWTPKHINRILNGFAEPSMASLDFMAHILNINFVVSAS